MLPAQPNQSLVDGLACLQALASASENVGVHELARQLGLEPTRVHRLLKTLAHLGIAEQDERKKYRPGPGLHVLAAQSLHGSGLLRRAFGPLEQLQAHKELVALGVLWRDKVSYLYHWRPGLTSAEALGRRDLFDASRSSIGLVLLAAMTDDAVRELYRDKPIPGFTGITELLKRLRGVRQAGFARVEIAPGAADSIAVPLGTPAHAAIAVSGQFSSTETSRWVGILEQARAKIDASAATKGSNK